VFAAASIVVSPINNDLFSKRTFVGLCIGACVYAAVANKYLHYVSDAYIFHRNPENIFYKFAGEWIIWDYENKSAISNASVWFVALIADSSRCLEQSVRVPNALEELYRSATGYNSLCKERTKLCTKNFTWIPHSTKASIYSHSSRIYNFMRNQMYRTVTVINEMICLAAFIGDFLSTFMWTPESTSRNASRILINLAEAKKRLINDTEGTVEMLKKNRPMMEKLFSSSHAPIDLDTYYSWIGPCAKSISIGNSILAPVAPLFNKLTDICVAGVTIFAQSFGFDVSSPHRTGTSEKGSPFRNLNGFILKPQKLNFK
jgi:hypothetical protein